MWCHSANERTTDLLLPDDQRFLMAREVGGGVSRSHILDQSFFDELKRRVPD